MRLVLDTNVIISGLLWGGPPRHLLDLAQASKVELCTCDQLLQELADALAYPKFANRVQQSKSSIKNLCQGYAMLARIVTLDAHNIPLICRDPNDNVVLACAHTAGAEYIVTGDHDLLVLKNYHHIAIISVSRACQIANSTTP